MNINFNYGFNKVPVGQQGTRQVKEDRNAEVTGQSVQPGVVSGETIPEQGTYTGSHTRTEINGDKTKTVTLCWTGSFPDKGVDPNNNASSSDVLKLHSMNYNIR